MTKSPLERELAEKTADFSTTAEAISAEYKKDTNATFNKYKGKIVDCEGVVDIMGSTGGKSIVTLSAKGGGVMCAMITNEP